MKHFSWIESTVKKMNSINILFSMRGQLRSCKGIVFVACSRYMKSYTKGNNIYNNISRRVIIKIDSSYCSWTMKLKLLLLLLQEVSSWTWSYNISKHFSLTKKTQILSIQNHCIHLSLYPSTCIVKSLGRGIIQSRTLKKMF